MSINLGRTNALHPPITSEGTLVSRDFYLRLRPASLSRKLLLARYFVTKRFIRREDLSIKEEFALYALVEDLSENRCKSFLSKHHDKLLSLQCLKKLTGLSSEGSNVAAVVKLLIRNKLFLSPRAYLGLIIDVNNVVKRVNLRLRKNPPPKPYVGVGYKDTGHRREPQLDGSPSWQEVSVQQSRTPSSSFVTCRSTNAKVEVTLVLPSLNHYTQFDGF